MQPPDNPCSEPEPPDDINEQNRLIWHKVVFRALSSLKGWQAVPSTVIALYFFVGVFGPNLAPFKPFEGTIAERLCPPLAIDALSISPNPRSRVAKCSATNIFGTDHVGRDIFSRLFHGAQTSLLVVGSSVLVGTVVGSVVGALVNGWSSKPRLIAYLIVSFTAVPFGIFVLAQPHALYIFGVINLSDNAAEWSAIVAFSSFSAVLTFALVAVAYWRDDTCRDSWFTNIDAEDPRSSFCRQLHIQIFALAPWIGLAAIASAALIFLHSGSSTVQTSAVTWSIERAYLFEHIGMFSPFVPMILVPIAFVSLGAWWVVHHLQVRFKTVSKPTPKAARNVDNAPEEPSSDISLSTEEISDNVEAQSFENESNNASIGAAPNMKRRRWILAIIAIVAAIAVIRFGVAEAVPTSREIAQDSVGDYQSAKSQSVRGRMEAVDCANEMSSRLRTLRSLPPEALEIEASQHCLDLYFQHRNAPSHRLTIDYALHFVTQSLTLALIGSIVAFALWMASAVSTSAVRRTVEVCVVLVALIGLTMTFGISGWSLAVVRWLDPVVLAFDDRGMAITRALYIVRDFSVALGISYLTVAFSKPTIRFGKTAPKLEILSNWAYFWVPCVLLTSGLLVVFHYRFPAYFLFFDNYFRVIADPSEDQTYLSPGLPLQNWLWTYWFAVIGYAALVFAFFYAAISGLSRFAIDGPNRDEIETPASPSNPSRAAGPT